MFGVRVWKLWLFYEPGLEWHEQRRQGNLGRVDINNGNNTPTVEVTRRKTTTHVTHVELTRTKGRPQLGWASMYQQRQQSNKSWVDTNTNSAIQGEKKTHKRTDAALVGQRWSGLAKSATQPFSETSCALAEAYLGGNGEISAEILAIRQLTYGKEGNNLKKNAHFAIHILSSLFKSFLFYIRQQPE